MKLHIDIPKKQRDRKKFEAAWLAAGLRGSGITYADKAEASLDITAGLIRAWADLVDMGDIADVCGTTCGRPDVECRLELADALRELASAITGRVS